MQHDYIGLANQFGYALANSREPVAALEADYLRAVASPYITGSEQEPSIMVKYFSPNSTGLFAVVECDVPVHEGAVVLLELIVAGKGDVKGITVEGISGVGDANNDRPE